METLLASFVVVGPDGTRYEARNYQTYIESHNSIHGKCHAPNGERMEIDGLEFMRVVKKGVYEALKYGQLILVTSDDPNAADC